MYQHGWYQIAFERELAEGLTPVQFAERRLMTVKQNGSIRVLEATCPHRGAHLAYGGKLDGDEVVCPFHGNRIHLGNSGSGGLSVRDYPSLISDGMVFVRLSDMDKPDLPGALEEVRQRFALIPGFTIDVDAPLEVAADNAVDNSHFKSVHGILNEPVFTVHTGPYGELRADGEFVIPTMSPSGPARVKYSTGAFSPGLVISEIAGDPPFNYVVISTGIPAPEPERCTIRVTLGMKRPVDEWFTQILMEASRQGLEKDRAIWTHVASGHTPAWTPKDTSAIAFMQFCKRFRS